MMPSWYVVKYCSLTHLSEDVLNGLLAQQIELYFFTPIEVDGQPGAHIPKGLCYTVDRIETTIQAALTLQYLKSSMTQTRKRDDKLTRFNKRPATG